MLLAVLHSPAALSLTGSVVFGESGLQPPLLTQAVGVGKSEQRSVSQCAHRSLRMVASSPCVFLLAALPHYIMCSETSSLLPCAIHWAAETTEDSSIDVS